MITFATDRFLDVEILSDSESGLKVPLSAITTQEFFLIPKDYITKGGSNGATGVLRETAGENGSLTTEFVATQIYQENDENYYLDDSSLRVGDHLIKPESTESYTVSQTASLTGVFNINKGYADFKGNPDFKTERRIRADQIQHHLRSEHLRLYRARRFERGRRSADQ